MNIALTHQAAIDHFRRSENKPKKQIEENQDCMEQGQTLDSTFEICMRAAQVLLDNYKSFTLEDLVQVMKVSPSNRKAEIDWPKAEMYYTKLMKFLITLKIVSENTIKIYDNPTFIVQV